METVDVIIPCRGHAAYLKEAVDSVLSQEGDINVHVIIVCDDDEEAFTVASNAAESGPVTALLLDSHVGTYVAINAGLRERRGDWVTFCGADDMFTADRVGMLLDASANDGWRAVANTWHIKVDKEGNHLKLGAETLGGVFMYHAEMVEALGGFKAWPCSADTEFLLQSDKKRWPPLRPLSACVPLPTTRRTAYKATGNRVRQQEAKITRGCYDEPSKRLCQARRGHYQRKDHTWMILRK